MLAKTPPMGWNTWNTFGCSINEKLMKESADAFIKFGLKDAGYEYLVIDDCWSERQRDKVTDKIVPDKEKFPNGMKAVSDYVHSKGLKFGMYSCAGVRTCGDFPGSFDHEYLDAQTFADYGCDFLKYDFCYKPSTINGALLYKRISMAMKATGREMLLSACNWGGDESYKWMRSVGAHMYRSTGDIQDNFQSFKDIAMSQVEHLCCSAPGCFNDTDMLTVGMYGNGNAGSSGCNDADYRTQFSLWCMFSAPLMLGCDIRNMRPQTLELITNKHLLRIDQDIEARPPIAFNDAFVDRHAFMKHLSDGEYAFAFYNFTESDADVPVYFEEMGLPYSAPYSFEMTDVFTNEKVGVYKEIFRPIVGSHDCKVYIARLVKD